MKEQNKSWVALCQRHNVNALTVLLRLRKGRSLEETITKEVNQSMSAQDHLGNTYKSLTAMCDSYGISTTAYQYRRRRGYTLEEALTYKPHKLERGTRFVAPNGVAYPSLKTMCAEYGIKYDTFMRRRNRGDDMGRALRPV